MSSQDKTDNSGMQNLTEIFCESPNVGWINLTIDSQRQGRLRIFRPDRAVSVSEVSFSPEKKVTEINSNGGIATYRVLANISEKLYAFQAKENSQSIVEIGACPLETLVLLEQLSP